MDIEPSRPEVCLVASAEEGTEQPKPTGRPPAAAEPRGRQASGGGSTHRDLHRMETVRGLYPGDRYVRVRRHRDFRRVKSGHLVPRPSLGQPKGPVGRALSGLKRLLLGRPIPTAEEAG